MHNERKRTYHEVYHGKRTYQEVYHDFVVITSERTMRVAVREYVMTVLEKTNNEILLLDEILSYLRGKCNKCGNNVSNLVEHTRYKNICLICNKKYKP